MEFQHENKLPKRVYWDKAKYKKHTDDNAFQEINTTITNSSYAGLQHNNVTLDSIY